jgi:hypothetical protein
LLNPRDSYIGDTSLLPLLEKLVVDLTGTQDMSLDLIGRDEVLRVRFGEVSLEDSFSFHLGQLGSGHRVSKEGFGEEDDELGASV